jgi:hypothetical protein
MYRNGAGFIEDKLGSDVFVIWACTAEQLLVELDELAGVVDEEATPRISIMSRKARQYHGR